MKYKDYYAILGVKRDAKVDEIKKAYRKLAHKFHPDVSRDPKGEEKFKEIAEAYQTLKDSEKRAAYDQLGNAYQAGQEFRPSPEWEKQFRGAPGAEGAFSFDDIDLSHLFDALSARARHDAQARSTARIPGQDYEVTVHLSLADAFRGTQVDLSLGVPEYDEQGRVRQASKTIKARIPKGATDGQRLRLRSQGGKGLNGASSGNLYLNIALHPHPLFRPSGHDLYLDLPLTPWEAALGATIEVPTLDGAVHLKIPPGTTAGRQLRLAKKGLPKPGGGEGHLFAIVQIVNPGVLGDRERELFKELGEVSGFNPRGHFVQES